MHKIGSGRVGFILAIVLAGACSAEKSSNPLSPAVAGPIAGVEITAPQLAEPAQGAKIKANQHPIRLLVHNASSSGVRPLSYRFEVSTDTAFETKVFARAGVSPGEDGRTSVHLEALELGRVYHWRVRAEDGANTGDFLTSRFDLLPNPFISSPSAVSPVNGTQVTDRRPTLRVNNSQRNEAVGGLSYFFQIARDQAFTNVVAEGMASEAGGHTAWTADRDLEAGAPHFWRARATDFEATGDWSTTQHFVSASAPAVPPPGGGGGGDNGGPGRPCGPPYPNTGQRVVECVMAKYPERLRAGVSLSTRQANMTFLRDRVIETGICGGMELGWNMKRGGPEKSIDYITWHNGREWIGVDIGRAYDATDRRLELVWNLDGSSDDARRYEPRPTCN